MRFETSASGKLLIVRYYALHFYTLQCNYLQLRLFKMAFRIHKHVVTTIAISVKCMYPPVFIVPHEDIVVDGQPGSRDLGKNSHHAITLHVCQVSGESIYTPLIIIGNCISFIKTVSFLKSTFQTQV